MVILPLLSNCSLVTTVTGAGVVRSLRLMRDPVTTTSSVKSRRCSAGGALVGTEDSTAGGCAEGGAGSVGGGACWDCAAASPADVIREWQGLGYNRRVLNLHRAACRIAADGWPENLTELPGVGRYTADAVARFALDRRVLPVDTNVHRVLDRTGGDFGPASAHALMDLGATICLARIPRCELCPLAGACPSRGRRYAPLRKQSRFEGSFRERRARTLKLVSALPRQVAELDEEAVESLRRDGLIELRGRVVALPE